MQSIHLKAPPDTLETIDRAVEARNKARPPGAPAWSRTAYVLAAALAQVEADKGGEAAEK